MPNRLIGTKFLVDKEDLSSGYLIGIVVLTNVGSVMMPMRLDFFWDGRQSDKEAFEDLKSYSGIYNLASIYGKLNFLFGGNSDESMLKRLLVEFGRVPGRVNPIFRKSNQFTVLKLANQQINHSFFIRMKVSQYVPPRNRGSLFKWYHGINN